MDDEKLLDFLREVVERIEAKADADSDQTGDEVTLREKLLMLEVGWRLKAREAAPAKPSVDWSKHTPLLLTLALVVALAVAAALGVDVRSVLP